MTRTSLADAPLGAGTNEQFELLVHTADFLTTDEAHEFAFELTPAGQALVSIGGVQEHLLAAIRRSLRREIPETIEHLTRVERTRTIVVVTVRQDKDLAAAETAAVRLGAGLKGIIWLVLSTAEASHLQTLPLNYQATPDTLDRLERPTPDPPIEEGTTRNEAPETARPTESAGTSRAETLSHFAGAWATHLALRESIDRQEVDLIRDARSQGLSWAKIGDVLGITAQSAHERFSRRLEPEADA